VKTRPDDLRTTRAIGTVLDRALARVTVTGGVPAAGGVRPPVLVAFGPPMQLAAGPAARRTVAAAAGEIHRTLAAHVAATRPDPTRAPEDRQP